MSNHQTTRDTVSHGGGLGFLCGMFFPILLMKSGIDLIPADRHLGWPLLIFIASPFAGMLLMTLLFRVGVQTVGRPAMAYVVTGMYLLVFAVVGWFAGNFAAGEGMVSGLTGALILVAPNVLLFYSRRDYLYGEDLAQDHSKLES